MNLLRLDLFRHLHPRAAAAIAVAVLAAAGCRHENPGAKLEQGVGDPANNSAAVANRLPPSQVQYVAKDADERQVVESPGVERGFADATGGMSLTGHGSSFAGGGSSAPASAVGASDGETGAGSDLMQRVQETIASVSRRVDDPDALEGVEAHVRDNEITLTGSAPNENAAQQLIEALQQLPGLVRVRSELAVGGAAAE